MMNPDNIMKITGDLIDAYKSVNVYKFLHIPVQSGSDNVLKTMNRQYKVRDFLKIVGAFRKSIPSITISTDVIAGFPGETDGDFRNSVELLEDVRPDIVNISKYGKRPGTAAAGMKQTESRTIKERSAELSAVVRRISLEKNKEWVGWKGSILITERGNLKNQFFGRNHSYKPVIVTAGSNENDGNLLGKVVDVEIKEAGISHLLGNIRKRK
jgi:tRNA A37 methylthiotransferase MiaB